MRLSEPTWWYRQPDQASAIERVLRPIGRIVSWLAEWRFARTLGYRSSLPVLCVGNFTVGGTGKTPTTTFLVDLLQQIGRRPVVLSRGYGGRVAGPVEVDRDRHTAHDVGDEPLLHAFRCETVVSRDRAAGARFIEERDLGDVIVMDDGLQNPSLVKDLSIALVDRRRGFGNGEVMPAGPLRAEIDFQATLADCVLITGDSENNSAEEYVQSLSRFQAQYTGRVLRAYPVESGDYDWLRNRQVYAYAAIANPSRFFDLVDALGAQIVRRESFPDHHAFSERDAERILAEAASYGALLVTTEKDLARLSGLHGCRGRLAAQSRTVAIRMELSDSDRQRFEELVRRAITPRSSA